jgi:hypothetical protein
MIERLVDDQEFYVRVQKLKLALVLLLVPVAIALHYFGYVQ